MRLPYLRILFEICYCIVIGALGIYSGYFFCRYSIEYLHRKAGFMISAFHETQMNDQGFYEITPPTIGE